MAENPISKANYFNELKVAHLFFLSDVATANQLLLAKPRGVSDSLINSIFELY
jgi:hypothetical protein